MRKLDHTVPLWLTIFAFLLCPAWNLYFMIIGSSPLGLAQILDEIRVAGFIAVVAWLIYGIACLLARPLRDTSAEEPWTPSEDFHIDIRGAGSDTPTDSPN